MRSGKSEVRLTAAGEKRSRAPGKSGGSSAGNLSEGKKERPSQHKKKKVKIKKIIMALMKVSLMIIFFKVFASLKQRQLQHPLLSKQAH